MRRATAAAVIGVAVAGLAGCTHDDAAERQARELTTFGGPVGWVDVGYAEVGGQAPVNYHAGEVDGTAVTYIDGDSGEGVGVSWTNSADEDTLTDRCRGLADWVRRVQQTWPSDGETTSGTELASTCEKNALGDDDVILDSGAAVTDGGRYLYGVSVGGYQLFVSLTFDPDVHR